MKNYINNLTYRSIASIVLLAMIGAAQAQAERPPMPPHDHEAGDFRGSDSGERGPRGERPPPPEPEKVASDMMSRYDADANSTLDINEFAAAISAGRPQHHQRKGKGHQDERPPEADEQRAERKQALREDAMEVAMAAVDYFDVNDDSALDQQELRNVLAFVHAMRPRGGPEEQGGPDGHRGPEGRGGPPPQRM